MKRKDEKFELNKDQKKELIPLLSAYIEEHYEVESGNLKTEMLLEYLVETAGIYCYNRGVEDAMAYMSRQVDDMFILLKEEKLR